MATCGVDIKRHQKYFHRFMKCLPQGLANFDTNRVTLLYFCISGLDVLDCLNSISDKQKTDIINWIYTLQILDPNDSVSGFVGSSTFKAVPECNWGHIPSTYCALCILLILGDDLSRVNRRKIVASIKTIQLQSGCCTAAKEGNESDMRFLFCAAAVSFMLNDWSGLNLDQAQSFIHSSISYEGGIAQAPGLEAHGGSTYCAIAALALSKRLDSLSAIQRREMIRWLVSRQQLEDGGFQGRPNKPTDTCYTFWVGATLKILCNDDDSRSLCHADALRSFVKIAQNAVTGGYSKWPFCSTDPMHSYLALAGLSMLPSAHSDALVEVVPMLNISQRAFDHVKLLHESWATASQNCHVR